MPRERLRIVVCGMTGLYPVGGVAWDYLQYVLGLAEMGHEVLYYEDTWSWPYHPKQRRYTDDGRYSAAFLEDFFRRFGDGLPIKWYYHHLHALGYGISESELRAFSRTADLLLNVSGASMFPADLSPACKTVFIDTDPGYNQIVYSEGFDWSENVDRWRAHVAAHDVKITYAEKIGEEDCGVPEIGFRWLITRMPIVLRHWSSSPHMRDSSEASAWTTVMTWNAFKGRLLYQGREYFSKDREFEKILSLPLRSRDRFVLALGGLDAPAERLREAGWEVVDAPSISETARSYQAFIHDSRGEISVAKNVYVALRTGWFSCRSACYLAAGRPVVAQDTGFSEKIPCGDGLFAFRDSSEALDALNDLAGDYDHHAQAARDLAEEYFDAPKVLGRLLDDVSADPLQ